VIFFLLHTMIDAIDSLAFTIESSKGAYALLVGSGISSAAEIPTGEQVTIELIRRLSQLGGEDCGSNPRDWYKHNFGEEADYSVLLSRLARTQYERCNLLREFFEPSEKERQRGAKMPTLAHKEIAQLVLRGYIRVIITTNFDHLLEKALEDVGISPVVISTKDAAESAPSIIFTNCTIIKVNGDYLDPRIRNTYQELEEYDDATNCRLNQILDEFGIIVCGWSAGWDIALRKAIERCKNHRFWTYWTDIDEPKEMAKKLITLRGASFIKIADADTFFHELTERIIAIESYKRPHPISKQILVARIKRYLVNNSYKIELYDLVSEEIIKSFENLSNLFHSNDDIRCYADMEKRLHLIESLTESILAMVITGCYWGSEIHKSLWVMCIEGIANLPIGQNPWLRQYSALLLFYGGGMASIANDHFDVLAELLMKPAIVDANNELPPVLALIPDKILDENNQKNLFMNLNFNKHTPLSTYLYEFLREPMKELLHDENKYRKCFDRFEYLVALQHAYLKKKQGERAWGPIGCWRSRRSDSRNIQVAIKDEAVEEDNDWPILKGGLFDGDIEKFLDIKNDFDSFVEQQTFGWIP
jgi:hypothetical protein